MYYVTFSSLNVILVGLEHDNTLGLLCIRLLVGLGWNQSVESPFLELVVVFFLILLL